MSKTTNALTAILVVIVFTSLCGCSNEAKKARHLERADAYHSAGDYEKAKIEYLSVLKLDPLNARSIRQLGLMLHEQGAPAQAYRFLAKAQELFPTDAEVSVKLGLVQLAVGDFVKAQAAAIAILNQNPSHDEALLLLSESSVTPDMIATADKWIDAARAQSESKAAFHIASSQLSFRKQDMSGAEAAIRRALKAEPKSALAHMAMGDLLSSQAKLAQVEKMLNAESSYKTASELAPLRSPARLKYAEFKAKAGLMDEAKRLTVELTQKAPDYLPAWELLAQIAYSEKAYGDCIKYCERVLNVDQASFRSRQQLARARLANGQASRAVQDLEDLNKLFPNVPDRKSVV